ncbi:TetR/AcrR family transcriptional regulator [Paenibacillus maysiensis]|uniref:TetR/AcrR family transcriptional regulator n=1 Tax=Paenibacillus maysiensis TaxID=1155954 RepID=UPI00046EF4BC|nr:TetR/AcrR family transcriptional regulator [Paenibacillus maysiensis]
MIEAESCKEVFLIQPSQRLEHERSNLRIKRRINIIEAAQIVFTNKGFEQATMQEIAKEAGLGVATIFRYFPKKEQLIVSVASRIVQSEFEVLSEIVRGKGNCYDKLDRIFGALIFFQNTEHQRNSKLIEAFECYVAMSKEPLEDIEIYQAQYNKLIALFSELALLGEQDGSVRTDHMTADTIITMMNVFGNFSKKMAMLNGIAAFHTQVEEAEQFKILKKLFLDQLRA